MKSYASLLSLSIIYLGIAIGNVDSEKGKGWRIIAMCIAAVVWFLSVFEVIG